MAPYQQQTIHYKTFVKTAMALGLREVFLQHPDSNLRTSVGADGKQLGTKVTLDSPTSQAHYPAIVVKFYGRNIQNVGVGHEEYSNGTRFQHFWYDGDIALEAHALDPRTVDYLSNTIVQTITVGSLEAWTNQLFKRLNAFTVADNPDYAYNSITITSDKIQEFGESKEPTPWGSEDSFIYRNSYRSAVLGEYYSVPVTPDFEQIINRVYFYPYESDAGEPVPTGSNDPAPWVSY